MRGLPLLVALIIACRPTPSSEPSAQASPAATSELEPPWSVTLLDVPGHEPLPPAPRRDLWIAREGLAMTDASGRILQVSTRSPSVGGPEAHLLPALRDGVDQEPYPELLVIWADERVRADTLAHVLDIAGVAGWRRFALVVGKPGALEILRVDEPHVQGEPNEHDGPCLLPGDARPDPAAVQHELDELCTARGQPFAIRVRVAGFDTIGDVLWLIAADRRPPSCRLTALLEPTGEAPTCTGVGSLGAFARDEREDAIVMGGDEIAGTAVGGLGIRGTGRGGGGTGEGTIGLGKIGSGAPRPLGKDMIRRIVRSHLGEVRDCYLLALERDPTLQGRVEITFTIDSKGKVSSASVAATTIPDDAVGQCIAEHVARWKFPPPSGKTPVAVRYPFLLTPSG